MPWMILALAAAVTGAAGSVLAKKASCEILALYLALLMKGVAGATFLIVALAVGALVPNPDALGILAISVPLEMLGGYMVARALTHADVSLVEPLRALTAVLGTIDQLHTPP